MRYVARDNDFVNIERQGNVAGRFNAPDTNALDRCIARKQIGEEKVKKGRTKEEEKARGKKPDNSTTKTWR